MSIKDKIESLPDDAIISHIEYDHYAGGGYIDCSHADLKALSASHTALLEAAKESIALLHRALPETAGDYVSRLHRAVSEAEKL